jgi:hypothetical protein
MSTLVSPAIPTATAQVRDKRGTLALVLPLVVIYLGSLALGLASETFARAVELAGQY